MTPVTDPDLAALAGPIERPAESALLAARDRLAGSDRSLGRLDEVAAWLAAAQDADLPRPPRRARLLLVGPGGSEAAGRLAALLDVGVRGLDPAAGGPAGTTRDEAESAVRAGMGLVDDEVDAGTDLIVVADVAATAGVPAEALVGLLTRRDAAAVTRRGPLIDDAGWMNRCAAVRDTMRGARPVLGDHLALLAAVGGTDIAATAGILLRASARRTPVLLDGVVTAAAALVAQRVAFRAVSWWLAAHRSPEPAHEVALDRLGLDPLLDLGVRAEDGTAALLAVPLLRAAALSR
jgi:nicotinate-nucleotide--dimethylbenzimidazole phosphoribosyltransferase